MKHRKYSEGAPRPIRPVIAAQPKQRLTLRLSRLINRAESGCIEFIGAKNRDGYAKMNFRHEGEHVQLYAHRVFYTLATGREVPANRVLDHVCRNRCCVNPAHLRVVSIATNARAAVEVRKSITQAKVKK
jgi:hypothetical protein